MNERDPFAAVVRATREEFEPTRADRERVKRHLGAKLSAGLAGSGVATAGATASGKAALGGHSLFGLGKLLLSTVAITVTGGTALVGGGRAVSSLFAPRHEVATSVGAAIAERGTGSASTPQRSANVIVAPSTPDVALLGATAQSAVAEATDTTPFATAAMPRRAGVPLAVSNQVVSAPPAKPALGQPALEAELSLLKAAKRAAADGDFASALALLGRLDREQVNGSLLEERDALRVVISCKMGDVTGAQRVDAFARRYQHSVYLARLAAACAPPAEAAAREDSAARAPSPFTGSGGTGH